jgi:hypothetical protein
VRLPLFGGGGHRTNGSDSEPNNWTGRWHLPKSLPPPTTGSAGIFFYFNLVLIIIIFFYLDLVLIIILEMNSVKRFFLNLSLLNRVNPSDATYEESRQFT